MARYRLQKTAFSDEALRELEETSYRNFIEFNWDLFLKAKEAGRFAIRSSEHPDGFIEPRTSRLLRRYGITKIFVTKGSRRLWFTPEFISSDIGRSLGLEPLPEPTPAPRKAKVCGLAMWISKLSGSRRGDSITRLICGYGVRNLAGRGYLKKHNGRWRVTERFLKDYPEVGAR